MTDAKPRILVVDDDPRQLEILRLVLSVGGYDVAVAHGGASGLELLEAEDFDFVLADLRMPDVSGLELLAEAQARVPHTPIAIFTAYGSSATESAAKQLGAVAYVDGLWDPDALLETVRQVVKRSSANVSAELVRTVEPLGHATRRWVAIVVAAAQSNSDLPTLTNWAKAVGTSVGTLKRRCELCGVHAGASLDFARALRIVVQNKGRKCNWYDALDIAEPATMIPFLERAALPRNGVVPGLSTFLRNQRFVRDESLIEAVLAALKEHT